ncbi:MAG: hypothetical protein AB8E82_15700 [Aureispira sp.]
MTRIIEIRHLEDCLDGSTIKEVLLHQAIDATLVQHLGQFGQLAYYPHFAKPFFKLTCPEQLLLKGVEGNFTIRVRVYPPIKPHLQLLHNWLS